MLLSIGFFLLPALCAPLHAQTPGPKIEQQDLGPASMDAQYCTSPHGGHLATIARKGSRFHVLFDGEAGPKFDEIVSLMPCIDERDPVAVSGRQVAFSRDGKRWVYFGRQGQEYVAMVDGKEQFRTTVAAAGSSPRIAFGGEDGKHLLVLLACDNTGQQVWADGKKLPGIFSSGGMQTGGDGPIFSRDGARYAYIASLDSKLTTIVDGANAGYAAEFLRFTADGQHLLATAREGAFTFLVVDGKPKMKTDGISMLVMAPEGNGFAAVLQRLQPAGQFLVVNAKKVEGSDCAGISRLAFSPDGKHCAAICSSSPSAYFVLADGKKGEEYNAILEPEKLAYSADSSRLAYVAQSQNKQYVLINDDESDGFDALAQFRFSPDGKHAAYAGFRKGPPAAHPVYLDGKAEPASLHMSFDSFLFSADGARHACIADSLCIDGKSMGLSGVFGFSPDGKHWIDEGQRAADNKWGVFVDGKLVSEWSSQSGIHHWAFTPDGQHLYWMSPVRSKDGASMDLVTYLDGIEVARNDNGTNYLAKLDPSAPDPSPTTPHAQSPAWELGPDGGLTVLGAAGETIRRVRITPTADSSLDKLLAAAK